MGLKPYISDGGSGYDLLSIDEDFTNPLKTTHDGKNGTVAIKKVFIRNDDAAKYYTDIRIYSKDSEGDNIYEDVSYDETGWGVKLQAGNVEPSNAEWEDISWGNSISLDDIGSAGSGDVASYLPFWVLITSPPSIDAQNKKDIQLVVDYIEESV